MNPSFRNLCLLFLSVSSVSSASGLNFRFIAASDALDPQVLAGFQSAANRWSSIFDNNVTLTFAVGLKPLSGGNIGQTSDRFVFDTYSDVRTRLMQYGSSSPIDQLVDQNLPTSSTVPFLINHTSEGVAITNDPSGRSIYLDDDQSRDNQYIQMSYANARALGLPTSSPFPDDATIYLTSNVSWDFNPADGITPGSYDFVGVATHEIAHALGFMSSVDDIDLLSGLSPTHPYSSDAYMLKTLDLFRYSQQSTAQGVEDMTDDGRTFGRRSVLRAGLGAASAHPPRS